MKKSLALTLLLGVCAQAQPGDPWKTPGQFQTPKGTWQTPRANWQIPGDLQVPKEVRLIKENSRVRMSIGADTLFLYDKSSLTPEAEGILKQLGPQLVKFGPNSTMTIEGHTDSKGPADYNQKLSEARAQTVRAWLKSHHYLPGTSVTVGYGETQPVAANTKPNGSDNPAGRQKNRRVEIVIQQS